ncbi:2-keto-4-pentenoate hydratase [Alteribacter natronophilus]|uniref:2-keto-4-pentenoate hydratase n=1 Tax=Alteribacter natronophilus TaxID=2583810 RepID=UPI00110D45AA|nr:fumarylacetoacetate hydrolase family protein [Alteribacter natronophilus]TMW70609.1 2-keto-4-pentenoate hydratase [Alteribacter natronophilus]
MNRSVQELSDVLLEAEKKRNGAAPLTELEPDLTIKDAYRVQLETIQRKTGEGRRVVGKKIGLTSLAMQKLLGVDEPDYGHLLEDMEFENGSTIPFGRLLQPKAEGEIAFVMKKSLNRQHLTIDDVLDATDYVVPAIEIVDSRIGDWKIKLQDTIADNASCGLFVLGSKGYKPGEIDLEKTEMKLFKNEELINSGTGRDVLGHPAACVAWLGEKLYEYGASLREGDIVLSGALSAAVDVHRGDSIRAVFSGLGDVTVSFSN